MHRVQASKSLARSLAAPRCTSCNTACCGEAAQLHQSRGRAQTQTNQAVLLQRFFYDEWGVQLTDYIQCRVYAMTHSCFFADTELVLMIAQLIVRRMSQAQSTTTTHSVVKYALWIIEYTSANGRADIGTPFQLSHTTRRINWAYSTLYARRRIYVYHYLQLMRVSLPRKMTFQVIKREGSE